MITEHNLSERTACQLASVSRTGYRYQRKARNDCLALQLGAFVLCGGLVFFAASFSLVAVPLTILLAAIWATLFAPFHECTHQTAFRSRPLNTIGTWLSGIPFGMSPTVTGTTTLHTTAIPTIRIKIRNLVGLPKPPLGRAPNSIGSR